MPGSVEQFRIKLLLVEGPPYRVPGDGLDGSETRLAAFALSGQRLNDFQAMKTVVLSDMVSDGDNLAEARPWLHIRGRTTPRPWQ